MGVVIQKKRYANERRVEEHSLKYKYMYNDPVKFMEHTEYRIVNEHVTYRITARDWPSSYQYLIETRSYQKIAKHTISKFVTTEISK